VDQETETDPRFELKLDTGRSLPETIAEQLRTLVDEGEFRPGSKLPNESELARRMRVARSSVRTALQRLETQGVLEVKRGVGWHVRRVPPPNDGGAGLFDGKHYPASDLFEVRIALEGLAASLAAVRATEEEIDEIDRHNADHSAAGDDHDELLRSDIAFHEAIVRASQNELLIENYQQVVTQLTDWRYESYAERGVPLRSAREHAKVVRFLRNRDPVGARAAMNGHLHRSYDALPEIKNELLDSTFSRADNEPEWHERPYDK
jgi:GntR family transcriptional repressor for pyruvate dehydrogenase complex